jgi:hypothetical protein
MKVDYSQAKIYKITNDYNDDVYIGSTCDTLVKRFSGHKKSCTNSQKKDRPLYSLINEIGFDRFRIELLFEFSCNDKYELRQKEGEYIRKFGTLNCYIAGRTNENYKLEYKEKFDEYHQNYRDTNKHIIAQKDKQYYEQNKEAILTRQKREIICECGCSTSSCHLQRHMRTNKHINLMKLKSNEINNI